MATNKKLKVTLIRSKFNCQAKHVPCVAGLGLRRINHSVIVEDTPSNRGMINKISYLVKFEEV